MKDGQQNKQNRRLNNLSKLFDIMVIYIMRNNWKMVLLLLKLWRDFWSIIIIIDFCAFVYYIYQ